MLIGLLLVIGIFGKSSAAVAAEPLVSDFCKDPVALVCGGGGQASQVRENRIDAIEARIRQEALRQVAQIYHLDSLNQIEDLSQIAPPRVRKQAMKTFAAEMREGLTQYLKQNGVEQGALFDEIRYAVQYLVQHSPHLSANAKERFSQILGSVRFVSMADAAADSENSSLDIRLLSKGCAKDHFVDNAFADERKHGDRVIILCPGMLIAAVEFAKSEGIPRAQALSTIVATLGHELSHHIDFRDFPEEYGFLVDALRPYSSELARGTLEDHMSEISADFWGNETMALYLDTIQDPRLRAKMLRGSMDDLCGTRDEGTHPTGEFRIKRLATLTYCRK